MALIVESKYTAPWVGGVPYAIKDKASDFKFDIQSVKLSKPYSLLDGDTVRGKILRVEDIDKKEYPDLKDEEIEFVLYPLLMTDYLFISKSCWEQLFRERGLVLAFYISAKLENAMKKDGTEVPLYTMVDLKA
jgi:hypothetical protein